MASHDEIWDDSGLVNSWNEALAEYKHHLANHGSQQKYHSIHAEGAALPEGVAGELEDQSAKPSGAANLHLEGEDGAAPAVEVKVIKDQSLTKKQTTPVNTIQNGLETQQSAAAEPTAASLPGPGPQLMLGSVQDEELKKLLMSWYYAGYYTGLYEGKQKALHEQAQHTSDGLCSIVNSSMPKPGLPGFNDTDGSLSCYNVEGKEKHSSRAFSFVFLFAA
ncbi:hypothetical protein NEUTE2DRAFT_67043 [Neurospora tetrasperma FGSC 2509]|nr:hypothetical protein NEUTE2DRAFT_67043 [Neurospora tetrasperma FGSC 2509]